MSQYYAHMAARHLSDRLLLAHYDRANAESHIKQARKNLLRLLTGDSNVMPEVRAALVDLIENAIDDVHDMDVTFKDYAESVVDALLENVVPMPEGEK